MIKLADAEWKIMELLWEREPLSTMEIVHSLEDSMGWTRSTVITLLNRMASKGSVEYKSENKTKLYFSAIERSQAELEETRSLVNKLYGGNIGLMISSLLKHESLSQEEIDEIRKMIKDGE